VDEQNGPISENKSDQFDLMAHGVKPNRHPTVIKHRSNQLTANLKQSSSNSEMSSR